MASGESRPRPSPSPPVTEGAGPDLLQYLLDCETKRLAVAVRIEEERGIVFPETSIIVRDILRIRQAMDALSAGGASVVAQKPGGVDDELGALLAALDGD